VHIQRQFTNEPFQFLIFAFEFVVLEDGYDFLAAVLTQPIVDGFAADGVLLSHGNHPLPSTHFGQNFFFDLFGNSAFQVTLFAAFS